MSSLAKAVATRSADAAAKPGLWEAAYRKIKLLPPVKKAVATELLATRPMRLPCSPQNTGPTMLPPVAANASALVSLLASAPDDAFVGIPTNFSVNIAAGSTTLQVPVTVIFVPAGAGVTSNLTVLTVDQCVSASDNTLFGKLQVENLL